jgi:hydroxyethylthiazole kinase-like uncharacterized protein yjeF
VQPVLRVAEMREADARALASVTQEELVRRAGYAVAAEAWSMLGGASGRRVVVVAGKGNNGNDGRVAAAVLRRRGAAVEVLDAAAAPERIDRGDLVIDAAYGTGFAGSYHAPRLGPGIRVLAVDIPSGVHGDTGVLSGRALAAERTVALAALKPGLLMGDGAALAGVIRVADIGVPTGSAAIGLVDDGDVAALPSRPRTAHKWSAALAVVAGSPGMEGAAFLCARAASRAGAGMVRLGVPGGAAGSWPLEAVRIALPASGWSGPVLSALERCRALVIGPGLGRDEATLSEIRAVIAGARVPVVADADALSALGDLQGAERLVAASERAVVLTPHDGEYRQLVREDPGSDRVAAACRLARATGAVALVKGPTTAVASPEEDRHPSVLLATAGSPALATAGSGDVLAGVVGAFVARGLDPLAAAGLAAHVHGRAAGLGRPEGLIAPDLPDLVADWLSAVLRRG